MNVTQILEELAYDMGELPREAIEAAILKRKQITPFLLEILQDATNRVVEIIEDDNYQGHLYAMYLLAQFREKAAYPLILKLFSFPGEIPHAIAGDVLTEDLSRILASVCANDLAPLMQIIENRLVNEYVRAACLTALVILVGCGYVQREMIVQYIKALFEHKLERNPSFVWDNLILSSSLLYPEEVYSEIQKAYYENLVNTSFISLEEVSAVLSKEKATCLFHLFQNSELIEDTVSEMEKWISNYSFQ